MQEMAKPPATDRCSPARLQRRAFGAATGSGTIHRDAEFTSGRSRAAAADLQRVGGVVANLPATPSRPQALPPRRGYVDAFPAPLTARLLERGRDRFDVFCSMCHDRVGTGKGMIVQRGFTAPPSFHTDWSRGFKLEGSTSKKTDRCAGRLYSTRSSPTLGAMPEYAGQVRPPTLGNHRLPFAPCKGSEPQSTRCRPQEKQRLLQGARTLAMLPASRGTGPKPTRAALVAVRRVAGLAGCAVGAFVDTEQFFLIPVAFMAWLSIAPGQPCTVDASNLTGGCGAWSSGASWKPPPPLPLLLLLFLPIAFACRNYPWRVRRRIKRGHQSAQYLNVPFFLIRAGIYFVCVGSRCRWRLNHLSAAQDRTGDPAVTRRAQLFSGPGLVLYGLTSRLQASLADVAGAEWYSTIFARYWRRPRCSRPGLCHRRLDVLAGHPAVAQYATPAVWNTWGTCSWRCHALDLMSFFASSSSSGRGIFPRRSRVRSPCGRGLAGRRSASGRRLFRAAVLALLSRDVKRHPARLRDRGACPVGMSLVITSGSSRGILAAAILSALAGLAALVGVGGLWLAYFLRLLQRDRYCPLTNPR